MDELLVTFEWVAWQLPRQLLTRQARRVRRMWGAVRGNARALAGFNIFWTVPASFMGIYLQIFMKEQGLTEIEIGSIVSAQLLVQVGGALLGGWLADRFGRLRTVTVVDMICWPLAYLCFTLAHGYLAFAAGAMLVGGVTLLMPSWNALYLEGSPKSDRMRMFGIVQLPWFVGAMIASASGFLVRDLGVSEACRWVFAGCVGSTVFGVWYRSRFLADPRPPRGPIRLSLAEVKRFFGGHWLALQAVVRRRNLLIAFLMLVIFQAAIVVAGTYNYLYLADPRGVALPKAQLAVLPLLGGATVLVVTFLIVPRIALPNLFKYLLGGLGLMACNVTLLTLAPRGSLATVLVAALCGSTGFAMFNPAASGFWANEIGDAERPRIDAFRWVITTLANIPVPVFAGALFKEVHPRMPLLLVLAFYGLIAGCAWWAIEERRRASTRS